MLLTHGDTIDKVADGFRVIARSGNLVAGIANESKHLYGVQFHPEVDLTQNGTQIFKTFLSKISGVIEIENANTSMSIFLVPAVIPSWKYSACQ